MVAMFREINDALDVGGNRSPSESRIQPDATTDIRREESSYRKKFEIENHFDATTAAIPSRDWARAASSSRFAKNARRTQMTTTTLRTSPRKTSTK
eukprot:8693139-Pyramimonas_sp.AAC.1